MSDVNPASIMQQIAKYGEDSLPPVHLWNPPLCKNVHMKIDREGRWFFMNSPIGREKMVKLFSKVLRLDQDGHYYLVTPVEKIRLEVVDKPFLIIDFKIAGKGRNQIISFETNTKDIFLLDKEHPLRVEHKKHTNEPSPYVLVRDNLEGLISRNIFYKLVDISEYKNSQTQEDLGVWSRNTFFSIGSP